MRKSRFSENQIVLDAQGARRGYAGAVWPLTTRRAEEHHRVTDSDDAEPRARSGCLADWPPIPGCRWAPGEKRPLQLRWIDSIRDGPGPSCPFIDA